MAVTLSALAFDVYKSVSFCAVMESVFFRNNTHGIRKKYV